MNQYLVSYRYIDKMLRERFGTLVIPIDQVDNGQVATDIYCTVKEHLINLGVELENTNPNIKTCFAITHVWEL